MTERERLKLIRLWIEGLARLTFGGDHEVCPVSISRATVLTIIDKFLKDVQRGAL